MALAVLASLTAVTACAERGDEPRAVRTPVNWQPWQVSFADGGRGAGPSGEVNRCVQGVAPGNVPQDAYGGRGSVPKPRPNDPVHCDGTGFRGEPLNVSDGAHRPEDREPDQRDEFARAKNLTFTNAHDQDTGARTVRVLTDTTGATGGDVRWQRPIRKSAVHHAGSVIGDERTRITDPQSKDGDDPANFAPGGDLISWNARTGEERWRLATPKDEWCEPATVGGQLFASCRSEEYQAGKLTWYRLENPGGKDGQRLRKLTVRDTAAGAHELLGLDDGALVFLPGAGNDFPPAKKFKELLRVDSATGEQVRKPLPRSIDTGARPQLIDGDLYFAQRKGRELLVVDAASGAERWKRDTGLTYASAPTVSTAREEIYLVGPDGRMTALDREDGARLWHTGARAVDGGTNPGEMDPGSSVTLVRDVLVVSAGDTVFSVSPEEPEAEPATKRTL